MTGSTDLKPVSLESLLEENRRLRERVAVFESREQVTEVMLNGIDVANVFLGPDLRVQRFSPSAARLFGIGPSDIGKPLSEVAWQLDDPYLDQDIQAVLQDEPSPGRETTGRSGHRFMRRVLPVTESGELNRGLVISLFDVDAIRVSEAHGNQISQDLQQRFDERSRQLHAEADRRVLLERELRAERDFVSAILDSTNVLIIVTDRAHRVVRFNRACELASGILADEIVGQDIFASGQIPDSEADGVRRALRDVLAGRGVQPHENSWVHRDGSVRDFEWLNQPMTDESGQIAYVVASAVDVTRRNRAMQALRKERDLLTTMFDVAPAAIVVNDTQRRVLRVNQAGQKILGWTEDELKGRELVQAVVPEYDHEGIDLARRSLEQGEPMQAEFDILRRDGSVRRVSWKAALVRDSAGEESFIVGAGLDITDWLDAQGRERDRLADLAQLHRAHTAGELVAVLSHEINQPLAAITSYASAGMLTGSPDSGQSGRVTELFEKIADAAVRAGRVVRDLRAFVTPAPSAAGPIKLRTVLATSIELVTSYARRFGVTLDLQAGDMPTINADSVQVQHIMVNLLRNSVEAIAGAGMASGVVRIRVSLAEAMARITISDTGPGITQDDLTNLYQPFLSTKTAGLGMGFRISRTLAAANGGRIISELHAPGAIFHIDLPLAE